MPNQMFKPKFSGIKPCSFEQLFKLMKNVELYKKLNDEIKFFLDRSDILEASIVFCRNQNEPKEEVNV